MAPPKKALVPHLGFVEIHSLAHKLSASRSPDENLQISLDALQIMDQFKVIHPCYVQFYSILAQHKHELSSKYDESWVNQIIRSNHEDLFMGDEFSGSCEKTQFFRGFVPQFVTLFVGGDAANLQVLLSKASLVMHFSTNSSDLAQFTENRYFEFLFYQLLSVVFGQIWFPSLAASDELMANPEETTPELKWSQIERKCISYRERCSHFLAELKEAHPETVARVHNEFGFCALIQWLCAFAKLKEHRLTDFCDDFEALKKDIDVLDSVGLKAEAIICYGVASVASKPFKDLDFRSDEQILDFFTSSDGAEASLYSITKLLSLAHFQEVKESDLTQIFASLDFHIAYTLPEKTRGTFWEYLVSIIDLKAFLVIISVSERISRNQMLDHVGYRGASESSRCSVFNKLVMSMSVLNFGQANIYYHEGDDAFYNLPVRENTTELALMETIEELDHQATAEAVAAHVKTLLVSKYFA